MHKKRIQLLSLLLAGAFFLCSCARQTPSPTIDSTETYETTQMLTQETTGETTEETTGETTVETTHETVEQTEETEPSSATEQETQPTEQETQPTEQETRPTEQETQPTEQETYPEPTQDTVPNGGVAIPELLAVEASGVLVKAQGGVEIDYSNTKDGYVMVRRTEEGQTRFKVQLAGPTTTYTYNLPARQWVAFPLSDGNGAYKISALQNVTGSKYALVVSLQIQAEMTDAFAPFLRPNQFVDFSVAPNTVKKAAQLTVNTHTPLEKVTNIYNFVVGNLTYDMALATQVQSGYLPELDKVLEKKTGICFDYAALMTGMLRSQGVPTKLVVGYAGSVYHAWIDVWSQETGWINGVIYFDGTHWKRMDPTFAAGGSSDINEYIGNGENYTAKYYY